VTVKPGEFELGRDGPSALVVGVDGSPTSLRAAAYAAGLARRQHSPLIIVYARKQPAAFVSFADYAGFAAREAIDAQDEVEAQLREALRTQGRHWDIDARLVVRHGDPMTVLAEVAQEVRADAVIVGSSASLGHRITGSLAIRLVRAGRWPVTVVP
jgi:nucleotide-binding universal stress UspA family protein